MGVETWMLLVAVVVLLWLYSKWRHNYWSSRGVMSPPGLPFFGHVHAFISGHRWLYLDKFYRQLRSHKIWGTYEFFTPALMIADPELLKHIMVKDFEHFVDRRRFGNQKGSVMSEMLGNKSGEEWKNLRAVMTPTFSSGNLRRMFHLVSQKADTLVSFALKKAARNTPVDMKESSGRYTMDTIASCAFGIECNSFTDTKPVFAEKAGLFFNMTGLRGLKMTLMITAPKVFNLLGLKEDNPEIEFFTKLVKDAIAAREKGEKRGDYLDLLLEERSSEEANSNGKRVFGDLTLVAQSVLFLVAGQDTTASTLAFCNYTLAKHPHQQQILRQELQGLVKEYGSLTYEAIMEAKYLDAVVNETLRLYPPGTVGERKCTKQYRIPDTDVMLNPGDLVLFPLWSIHHDPQYWPDCEEFQPERFLPKNKGNIRSFTHLPFGMGPRNCIAMRFALLKVKVALSQLVLAAEIKLAPGQEKLEIQPSPFLMRPKHGIMVMLTPLKKE